MGQRGPTPTPSAVLKLRGTYRKHRRRGEPHPDQMPPECPDWLDDVAKEAWAQLIPQLQQMGVLTQIDGNALCRYCQFWSRWKKAELFIAKHGEVYPLKDEQGKLKCLVQIPQVAIAHKLGALLTRLEQEFGLTPSSRARLQCSAMYSREDDIDDPFQEFMRPAS